MENEVKRAVGGAVAEEHDPDGIAETKGLWVAPKLRTVWIASEPSRVPKPALRERF